MIGAPCYEPCIYSVVLGSFLAFFTSPLIGHPVLSFPPLLVSCCVVQPLLLAPLPFKTRFSRLDEEYDEGRSELLIPGYCLKSKNYWRLKLHMVLDHLIPGHSSRELHTSYGRRMSSNSKSTSISKSNL